MYRSRPGSEAGEDELECVKKSHRRISYEFKEPEITSGSFPYILFLF